MKKSFVLSLVTMFLMMLSGGANAALTTIGTANYNGTDYNLIWQDDNNGNSLVWLDYSNPGQDWSSQKEWAENLSSNLNDIRLDGYLVTWDDDSWRLPNAVGGNGYNKVQSEMGHLFYEELGNLGAYGTDGTEQTDYGLKNTGVFDQLMAGPADWYWTGTGFSNSYGQSAYDFSMRSGVQDRHALTHGSKGLAVRTGDVTTSPVPVPGALLLLSSGLLGIAGVSRRRNK